MAASAVPYFQEADIVELLNHVSYITHGSAEVDLESLRHARSDLLEGRFAVALFPDEACGLV